MKFRLQRNLSDRMNDLQKLQCLPQIYKFLMTFQLNLISLKQLKILNSLEKNLFEAEVTWLEMR